MRLAPFLVAALVALTAPAGALADVTVDLETDITTTAQCDDNVAGDCTLREAVDEVSAGDTIHVPAGHYRLTQGQNLFLNRDMTIEGAGARTTTIDATGGSRIAYVSGTGTDVVITGVTVTGGDAGQSDDPDAGEGGGFRVVTLAELILRQSAIVGNVAGNNGGGISAIGAVSMERSTVSGNRVEASGGSPRGGGISVEPGGEVGIANSTVSGNTVTNNAGPVARGGGIYAEDDLDLDHVTIAANRALDGSGLYQADLGGALLAMTDTLIAGNTGGACGGDPAAFAEDHNLADDATCALDAPSDRPSADAKLAPLDNYGGLTNTHALYTGSQAIDGSSDCLDDDQRGVTRSSAPCDIGAFEGSIAPPLPPPPGGSQPPPEEQLPPPVAGKSVNALTKTGTVTFKLPGTTTFVVLGSGEQIPLGTTVDATKGRMTLVAASNKTGGTATADFYDGIFRIGQTKGAKPITTLKLVEKLSCPKRGKASAAAKKKKRKLWGDGKGRFRTEGSYSSATVRGTRWLTQDTCTSTLTRVVRGSVTVRDLVKKKNVIVKAGKKYVAKRKP